MIQKILDKFGKTCWMTSKNHSRIPDYSGNMVSKFHVDWIKTQGEIVLTKPAQNNKFKEPDKTQYIWHSPNIITRYCYILLF